jgi:hypothetical protein
MAITKIEVERVGVISSKPFEAVVEALRSPGWTARHDRVHERK